MTSPPRRAGQGWPWYLAQVDAVSDQFIGPGLGRGLVQFRGRVDHVDVLRSGIAELDDQIGDIFGGSGSDRRRSRPVQTAIAESLRLVFVAFRGTAGDGLNSGHLGKKLLAQFAKLT